MDNIMDSNLAHQAIAAALAENWLEAIKINKKILEVNTDDIESYLRLARAFSETGKIKNAKLFTNKALKLDPLNTIAQKQKIKWENFKKSFSMVSGKFNTKSFLEEPGKTKLVNLINLGDTKLLSQLDSGDEVTLVCNEHRVSVKTQDGKYIGRLPDDISARLRLLIKGGNKYLAMIKSSFSGDVKVFIRELSRSERQKNTTSFVTEKVDYVAFTPPELVHKKDEIPETSSEEGQN